MSYSYKKGLEGTERECENRELMSYSGCVALLSLREQQGCAAADTGAFHPRFPRGMSDLLMHRYLEGGFYERLHYTAKFETAGDAQPSGE